MKIQQLIIIGAFSLGLAAKPAEPWTLEQALQQVQKNNPDARLAQYRITAAQAGLGQANSAFMPQLQFRSSYQVTDNPMRAFGSILNQRAFSSALDFNNVPDTDNLNLSGLLTVPLYAGGRNAAGRQSALAQAAAAKASAEAIRNSLTFEVSRAFFTIFKTREFIRATEAGVTAFESNLAIAQKRFDAGTLLRSDVLDVEVRLAQAREDLVRARHAYDLSRRALRNLLGIVEGEFEVADQAPSVSSPRDFDYTRRPEFSVNYQMQQAAEAEVRRAKSTYQPSVNAFGSADYDHGWKLDNGGGSYMAGVMLQWDLWDGNRTRSKVKEARSHLDAVREQERKLRLAIDFEVQQTHINLREAAERLTVTDKVVDQAAESVQLTRSRFEQGLAISTQLIDAETALVSARVRRAEAESNQRIAIAALRKALGLPQLDSTSN